MSKRKSNPGMAALTLLGTVFSCFAQDHPPPPVSVKISTTMQSVSSLGDILLEIRISNLAAHPVHVNTIDADPPIIMDASYVDGQDAIITSFMAKDGTTRNIEYVLAPDETRNYRVLLKKLLPKWQKLAAPQEGEVSFSAIFPDIERTDTGYKSINVRSNIIHVKVLPPTP